MVSSRHWATINDVRIRIMSEMHVQEPEGAFLVGFVGATRRAGTSTVAVGVARAFHEASTVERSTLLIGLSLQGKPAASIAKATPLSLSGSKAPEDTAKDATDKNAKPKKDEKPDPLSGRVQQAKNGFDVISVENAADLRKLFEDDARFWDAVADRYEIVCIDAGLAGSEAHVLMAQKLNLSLLVVDGKRITRRELARLRERMEGAHIMPDGVILNRKKDYLPRIFRAAVE